MRTENNKRKFYIAVFTTIFTLLLCVYFITGVYFYNFVLKTDLNFINFEKKIKKLETSNRVLTLKEANAIKSFHQKAHEVHRKYTKNNIFGNIKLERIFIKSFDGLKLHALKVLNNNVVKNNEIKKEEEKKDVKVKNDTKNHKWAIIIHGYGNDCETFLEEAKHFYDFGFNLLIPDLRGYGYSESNFTSMGLYERIDIRQWINKIIDIDQFAEILLYGISMGAATVMMTAGDHLPKNVKLGIEDCGYTSAYDELKDQLKNLLGPWNFISPLVMSSFMLVTRLKAGFWIGDISSIEQLKKSKLPILFIHGDKDTFVPFWMLDKNFDVHGGPKEKVVIKDSIHAKNASTDPQLYWNSVKNFTGKYIKM